LPQSPRGGRIISGPPGSRHVEPKNATKPVDVVITNCSQEPLFDKQEKVFLAPATLWFPTRTRVSLIEWNPLVGQRGKVKDQEGTLLANGMRGSAIMQE
jgi:hypothetical protein